MKNLLTIIIGILLLSGVSVIVSGGGGSPITMVGSNETIGEKANCSEQLQICLDGYNELFMDFQNGTNCGTAFILVKDLNKQLGEERDNCEEELEKKKEYKIGFYMLFVVLILIAIILVFYSLKNR